jgi:secondary thiamine-phosphate synthase enzyme
MDVFTASFHLNTKGETDMIDITKNVQNILSKSGVDSGIVSVTTPGSTAGITTIEYENGLLKDLETAYERVAPRDGEYAHNEKWGDGNGYAHIRASLTGQDITIPFSSGKLILGTWQQIILIDFDNRTRKREVIVQVIGQ